MGKMCTERQCRLCLCGAGDGKCLFCFGMGRDVAEQMQRARRKSELERTDLPAWGGSDAHEVMPNDRSEESEYIL